jgi:hypothetical protein
MAETLELHHLIIDYKIYILFVEFCVALYTINRHDSCDFQLV